MRLPPHRFYLFSKLWRVRYGAPKKKRGKPDFDSKTLDGCCDWTNRIIYLKPQLRLKKNHLELWKTFAHEIMHAWDKSSAGRGGKYRLRHEQIDRLEGAFCSWMIENSFYLESPE